MWFDRIKKFYEGGYWTIDQVKDAVVIGKITADQYEMITSEVYAA